MNSIKTILASVSAILLTLFFAWRNGAKSERIKQKSKTNEKIIKDNKETKKLKRRLRKLSRSELLDRL